MREKMIRPLPRAHAKIFVKKVQCRCFRIFQIFLSVQSVFRLLRALKNKTNYSTIGPVVLK